MSRPTAKEADKVIETWNITHEGTVWVWVWDRREDRYGKQRVGGRSGSKVLHISRDDRKFNQEQVIEEMKEHDPFTNGSLILVDTATPDEALDTRYHLSNDDLMSIIDIKDIDLFKEEVDQIGSELVLRRLAAIAEKSATVAQLDFINELLANRYPVGGTQRTVREMLKAGEISSATRI